MTTDQYVTDLTTAINDYVDAVSQFQMTVQAEVAALNQQITALHTQVTNAPDDQAAIQNLILNLKTQTASVTTAANAILPAPAVTVSVPGGNEVDTPTQTDATSEKIEAQRASQNGA